MSAAIRRLALGALLGAAAGLLHASPLASLKASTNEQLLERIEAEVAFAKGLAGLTPARAAEWNPLIARADDIVRAMKAGGMRGDPAAEVVKAVR